MKYLFSFILFVVIASSCNESHFLKEKPLSIYTPENSLVTLQDFQGAVNTLYNKTRFLFHEQTAHER